MKRNVYVENMHIINISDGSTCICGRSEDLHAYTEALAVQRQVPVFYEDEGSFEDYPIFTRDIPKLPDISDVEMDIIQEHNLIRVNRVDVLSVASASTVQIGTTEQLDLEARVKAIRHFITDQPKALERYKGIIILPYPD
ncbi:spore gernimation protein KA [Paenibacillus ihbetae]|uniref:Spore gernimation protein KA n=1 Tax=Paenibacillus ihbetae TaxID=1870820 RepID=A0A1B2DV25_9BACL|nr:spore germination protein GerPE [Paenibacillus ihbetae]ANY71564.1 spore gernimation protein KA [Paenibacillus ihbetae]